MPTFHPLKPEALGPWAREHLDPAGALDPLACAVSIASLDLLLETGALQNVARLEKQMREGLEPLRSRPNVGDVRVIGWVGAVELVGEKGYFDDLGPRLAANFLDRGLLLRPLGNVVYFMPPHVIRESETAWALEQIAEVVADIQTTGM